MNCFQNDADFAEEDALEDRRRGVICSVDVVLYQFLRTVKQGDVGGQTLKEAMWCFLVTLRCLQDRGQLICIFYLSISRSVTLCARSPASILCVLFICSINNPSSHCEYFFYLSNLSIYLSYLFTYLSIG